MASPMEAGGNPTEKLMIEPKDDKILEKVQQIHSPDGREIDTQVILRIIEDILHSATPVGMQGPMPEKTIPADAETSMLDALSYVVNEIYFEMTHEFLRNGDGHTTTLSLLEILSNYSWDAKLVLLLAAFVLYYAEFWFPVKNKSSSKLAQKMDFLRKVPETDVLKERLGVLTDLIMDILDLVQFIILFRELPPDQTLGDVPAVSAFINAVPIAVYRAIRGVLICVAYIAHLSAIDNEHSPSSAQGGEQKVSTSKTDKIKIDHFRHTPSSAEDWNRRVSTLTENIRKINEHLKKQLTSCFKYLEDKKLNDAYIELVSTCESDGGTLDKFLNALLIVKENEPPLFDFDSKQKVNFDCLKYKQVFFLISGLHDDSMELDALSLTYKKWKEFISEVPFEIVWIPILEGGSETKDIMSSERLNEWRWLSVSSLELIDQRVLRFVREKFHYEKLPILVAMDDQGKVVNPNALHIMIAWTFRGFPYTTMKEKTEWEAQRFRLEQLMAEWDFDHSYWMGDDEHIIVYGGGDMEWIRNFTTKARQIAQANNIEFEMLYVGKSGKTSSEPEMKTLLDTIEKENLSKFYLGKEFIWFFWVRLQSMLFSKINVQLYDDHNPLVQLVEKLMIYDRIGTWALFGKGSDISLTARGPEALKTLENFEAWKQDVGHDHLDFLDAFKKQYNQQIIGADHPCCTLDIHDTSRTPKNVLYPECSRSMEQQSIFSCSHD